MINQLNTHNNGLILEGLSPRFLSSCSQRHSDSNILCLFALENIIQTKGYINQQAEKIK